MGKHFSNSEEQVAKRNQQIQEEQTASDKVKVKSTPWDDKPPFSIPDPSLFLEAHSPLLLGHQPW